MLSRATGRRFVELSAVTAGVQGRPCGDRGGPATLGLHRRETVLFIDEIHRFSKAQQDALLPGGGEPWVILVAATTENPFF